jgi:hypothetical protein
MERGKHFIPPRKIKMTVFKTPHSIDICPEDAFADEVAIIECFLGCLQENDIYIACGGLQHPWGCAWENFLKQFDLPAIAIPPAIHKELAFCWIALPEGWESPEVFAKQVRLTLSTS